MRTLVVLALVFVTALPARAGNRHVALDARSVPSACAALAWVPDDARIMTPTLEAYTSIASCIVRERTRAMKLAPDRDTMARLDFAIHPAIDLLDTAAEVGDLSQKIVALHAKADVYNGLIVRVRASAGTAVAASDVDALVAAWRDASREANRDVLRLAESDPRLVENNPVLLAVVKDVRSGRALGVATR